MLSKLRVQHYKSLFDTEVDLEPLTVFIGPNGSGKSNICEALAVLSDFLKRLIDSTSNMEIINFFSESLKTISTNQQRLESKFWHGKLDYLGFEVSTSPTAFFAKNRNFLDTSILVCLNYDRKEIFIEGANFRKDYDPSIYEYNDENSNTIESRRRELVSKKYLDSDLYKSLKKVNIYDFAPSSLSSKASLNGNMERTGEGIAYALVDILHTNRQSFDELEERLTRLVPNIKKVILPRGENQTFLLELVDRYSEHHIPSSDISDGTLRILAFLTALYQENTPSIICFEEIENGVHPWLLHKMMELLKIVSTEGITGKPVQVLITTHSPLLLNYVEPYQVRAVELDKEGKTQVHKLPIDSLRFQKALEAYDGALGELWFTNVFGGNPE
ncbi:MULTISPECIES: AAA family ATPase [unclassified Dolichospermum]|uniref:AAA family ATPase n=1 Tax=unclassified Dolichospermum TaxID=2622029 RepID=UPI001448216F|nr:MULTISPECIES: ATP-binding protein [unclassified Dolichospermum]MTJ19653.1 AAA family ATPase [Dolichospermum sp. UHCC 0299]MTJ39019.1 AAA family ATPase [Dolichospermum sp. UHCC 0406]